ncbi:lipopolysaccharide biosynthesis protein [Xanthomonas perforans]
MSLDGAAARGLGWAVVEKWSSRLVSLVVLFVLGRLLTPTEFGLIALATVFVTLLNVFVDQGFGRALVQRDALDDEHADTAFWVAVVSSLLLGAALVAIAPALAAMLQELELAPVIQVMSVGLVLYALSTVPQALLEREFGFKALARRRVIATTLGGIAAIIAAGAGFGVWSLVVQVLTTAAVGVVVLWTASAWRPHLRMSGKAIRDLWATGVSIVGIELVGFLNGQADKLLVGALLDAQALGYYFFAMRIISIIVELFSTVLSSISLTTFSRLQNDHAELRRWLYRLSSVSCLIAMPAFAVLAATSPQLVPMVFGEQWTVSGHVAQALCLLGAVNAIAVFDRSALIAVGRNRLAFLLTFGQAVVGCIFIVAGVWWGVIGVALAVSIRQVMWWPVRLAALKVSVAAKPSTMIGTWLKPFLIAAVAAACGALILSKLQEAWPSWPAVVTTALIVIVIFLAGAALALRREVRSAWALVTTMRKGR